MEQSAGKGKAKPGDAGAGISLGIVGKEFKPKQLEVCLGIVATESSGPKLAMEQKTLAGRKGGERGFVAGDYPPPLGRDRSNTCTEHLLRARPCRGHWMNVDLAQQGTLWLPQTFPVSIKWTEIHGMFSSYLESQLGNPSVGLKGRLSRSRSWVTSRMLFGTYPPPEGLRKVALLLWGGRWLSVRARRSAAKTRTCLFSQAPSQLF